MLKPEKESAYIEGLKKARKIKEFWVTHEMALKHGLLSSNDNLVVIAPTASGKTLVAELAMFAELEEGFDVLYLVPSSALAEDKKNEFRYLIEAYGGQKNTRVHVTTFEMFYKTSLLQPEFIERFGLAVVDEFHVLYDRLRGYNLEKALTLLKTSHLRIICLSATFHDSKEVSEWLRARLVEIPDSARKIPLSHGIVDLTKYRPSQTIQKLYEFAEANSIRPCILFCATRDSAKSRAIQFAKFSDEILTQGSVEKAFSDVLKGRSRFTKLETELAICLSRGVGFHHSGLDPRLRNLVASFFIQKTVGYLFATTGLAYGVNYPARSVMLCDLFLYGGDRQIRVPVYLYQQMAGRAGRPGLGDTALSYLVAKKPADIVQSIPRYIRGELERAVSRISEDDYFRKNILELIFSGKKTDGAILDFFQNTLYNFQSERALQHFSSFDLSDTIRPHINYLDRNGFIRFEGVAGYRLLELGTVITQFLFETFATYTLESFRGITEYIRNLPILNGDFSILYAIPKEFEEVVLGKPKGEAGDVERYFEVIGVSRCRATEYSAYAIFSGWIENIEEVEIESRFHVYASQLPQTARELSKIMELISKIASIQEINVSSSYSNLINRVRDGVRSEELPFTAIKGIGRDIARQLFGFSRILSREEKIQGGSISEIFSSFISKSGNQALVDLLTSKVPLIGATRARRIVEIFGVPSSSNR